MLSAYVRLQTLLLTAPAAFRSRADERGQATAEYALVLLGAAALAVLVGAWASRTDRVGRLFDAVVDQLLAKTR